MTNLLKILLLLPFIVASLVLYSPKTFAASGVTQFCQSATAQRTTFCSQTTKGGNSTGSPVLNIIKTAISILSFIIGIAAVITIIIAGLRMVLSEGKPENISSARSAIIFAVIGIIVAVCAQLIVVFVLDRLG